MAAINGYADAISSGVQSSISGGSYGLPVAWYVGLFTSAVWSDGSIGLDTEVEFDGTAANGYARLQINAQGGAAPAWSAPDTAANLFKVYNMQQAEYPVATDSWGTITYAVVMRTPTGIVTTDMIFGGALSTSKNIGIGTTAVFLDGSLSVTTQNS